MKHAREDYNCIQDHTMELKIPEDEPVFLLRAQDKNAPGAVREWARMHRLSGGSHEVAQHAIDQAKAMEDWQAEHFYKLADL